MTKRVSIAIVISYLVLPIDLTYQCYNQCVSFCQRTIDSQEAPGRLNRPGEVPERPHSSHPLILSTSSPIPMSQSVILVTGGTGLVRSAIKHIIETEPAGSRFGKKPGETWVFASSSEGDLR